MIDSGKRSEADELDAASTKRPPDVLQQHWYIAAWSSEIGRTPFARRIADEAIVLYRTESGEVAALADRCPHRRFPLSRGTVVGDTLQCGYHGFTFAANGSCVSVPGQEKIPGAARVQAFPVVERSGVVWVFPGDSARADASTIPETPWITEWTTVTGYAHIRSRAMLLMDNLLDLSHETYLHPTSIGTSDVAETPITVEQTGRVLHVRKQMIAAECPPFYRNATGMTTRIDRSQNIEYTPPGYYQLNIRVVPTGSTEPGFKLKVIYGLTPETATTTHDFWAVCRDFARDDAAITDSLNEQQIFVVREDVDALNALEAAIASDASNAPEVSIGIDRGGLVARRMIAQFARHE